MPPRQTYIAALLFSAMAGIINIFGIRQLNLVLTNITGHFSEGILGHFDHNKPVFMASLAYALVYGLGSFWSYGCFFYADKYPHKWVKTLPIVMNLGIVVMVIFTHKIYVYPLLWAMSAQNAFGTMLSNGQVRASQITGVLMNTGQDMAQYFLGKPTTTEKRLLKHTLAVKLLNMVGFVLGGGVAAYYNSFGLLWVLVGFYLGLVLIKSKT